MKYLTLLLILLLSLVLLCFLYLNQGLVTIKYYPGPGHQTPPIPLFAVIMLAIIAGVLMVGMIGFAEQLRLRFRLRQAQRANTRLEKRLEELGFDPDGENVPPVQEVLPEVVDPVKLPDQPA